MSGDAAARTKRLALIAAILASAIAAIDSSAVNVALPAISHDLGGGLAGQQWTSNAYLLTLSALILLAGSLTDRLGERRVFVAGVTGFGIGSVLCAIAPTVGLLIAARALQGVAGAMLTPSALAIIVAIFPKEERGGAVGSWTAWGGIGVLAGPIVGGQLVDVASWRWIFAINVPLVALALWLAGRAVPSSHPEKAARVDLVGALLAAAGLAGISFGLIEQPVLGWSSVGVFGALAAGVALLTGFVVWERRTPDPMLPLDLFARRNFAVANGQTLAIYGAMGVLTFFLTIYLQQVAGFSALKASIPMLIPTVIMFGLSRRVGALADRLGPRPFLIAGPLLVAAGFLLMRRYGSSVSLLGDVLPAMVVFSLGLALMVSPLTATVLADADDSDAGIASAINNALARTASLIAVAGLGAAIAASYGSALVSRLAGRLPAAAGPALDAARRHTFAPLVDRSLPAGLRTVAHQASQAASVHAFHLAVTLGAALLVLAAVAGLALRSERRSDVQASGCAAGNFVGSPRAAAQHT